MVAPNARTAAATSRNERMLISLFYFLGVFSSFLVFVDRPAGNVLRIIFKWYAITARRTGPARLGMRVKAKQPASRRTRSCGRRPVQHRDKARGRRRRLSASQTARP